ncbi:hypothetical protein [Geothrix campi]|uniref:hypothetical protein n=1 Tax=Geothrix campi TaxID=2966450 RepID=UPI002148C6A9|nr:hypothetical protein [Geothrix sp. SG10]
MLLIVVTLGLLWALACLGLRLRLHGRLLSAGAALSVVDQFLKNLGGPWLRWVAVVVVVVTTVRNPGMFRVLTWGISFREVMAVVVAGAFRLFSTATLWAEFRAVEEHRLHRIDLRASLVWEVAFTVHVGLNTLPPLLWS